MEIATLNTSGAVRIPRGKSGILTATRVRWTDLDAFTRGYVEALFASGVSLVDGAVLQRVPLGFSDLAPEALAQIIADCGDCKDVPGCASLSDTADTGKMFWELRQEGQLPRWPAVAPYLADDGKVHLREVGQ